MMVSKLQAHDQIQNAVGGAEAAVRLPEPVRQDAVLGDAVQHAVRADDGRVHGAGQHQRADDHDERAERQPHGQRPDEVHGQAADRVVRRSCCARNPE